MDLLIETYADSTALVQYHSGDEYALPWGNERVAFYDAYYTPVTYFDGVDRLQGSLSPELQYNVYRILHLLPARAVPTDTQLTLSAVQLSGTTYRVRAEVELEAGSSPRPMRLFVVQVLDHWPATHSYYRNTFKQGAAPADLLVAPGAPQVVTRDFTLDADSLAAPQHVKFVAWVQAPAAAAPAQVYQAAVRPWPLDAPPGDWDGDGYPDATDNCPRRYNPDQADGDGDGAGDACDVCNGVADPLQADTDEDRIGDACDNCPGLHSFNLDDADFDGVGAPCDSCPDVPAPGGVDVFGRSRGCRDLDCDVDDADFALFAAAMTGPGGVDPADLALFAALQLNFTGPLLSPPVYAGAEHCTSCHAPQSAAWQATAHRTAFNTLVIGGNQANPLCFPCHTVGFGEASGFVDPVTTPRLKDVQCESCHGPGSNHVADPNAFPLIRRFEAALCGSCHQSCHGMCGDDHHPQHEQWRTSGHAIALDLVRFSPDAAPECLACHSADYRLAPPGQQPDVWTAVAGVDCVTCHDPHGGPISGQLRLPRHQLCADCHTMGAAAPPESPAQPQAEMLHSVGGWRLDGTPLTAPYTEHWWGIATECVRCHMHWQSYGGPTQLVDSGHSFRADVRTCAPCHSAADAAALLADLSDEIWLRFTAIEPYFDPWSPQYINPDYLPPHQYEPYLMARFNFELVKRDRSLGAHNPPYARALLNETEAFLGIPPWPTRGTAPLSRPEARP